MFQEADHSNQAEEQAIQEQGSEQAEQKPAPSNAGSALAEIERQLQEVNLPQRVSYETISFAEYLDRVKENPLIAGTAYQRLYAAIMNYSVEKGEKEGELERYAVFEDPFENGKNSLFGLQSELQELIFWFIPKFHAN